jgi:small conductance mechanosensitive channel
MARRVIVVVVVIATLLLVADVWGISTTPLIAFGSVIGVALGLGVQHAVRDMIAGFFILAEDQYRIGDDVEINGVAGTVADIRPRVTVLKDEEGSFYYLAHGTIEKTANRSHRT